MPTTQLPATTDPPFRDLFESSKPQTILEKIDQPAIAEKNKSAAAVATKFEKKTKKKVKVTKTIKVSSSQYE